MKFAIVASALFLFAFLGSAIAQESRPAPLKVLIVTGQNNHDWEWTTDVIEKFLEETGRFDVDVTKDPRALFGSIDAVKKYDLFFMNWNGERWGEPAEKNFLDAVSSGIGVFILHAANNSWVGWGEWERMCGLLWHNGVTGHGQYHAFDVDIVDRNHPVTFDMAPLKKHPDELYHKLVRTPGSNYRILMDAFSDPKTGGTGAREPMALCLEYGKGRVFHTPLGHVWKGSESSRATFADPQLRVLIARGCEWAARNGRVTIADPNFKGTPRTPPRDIAVPTTIENVTLEDGHDALIAEYGDLVSLIFDKVNCRWRSVSPNQPKAVGVVVGEKKVVRHAIVGSSFWRDTVLASKIYDKRTFDFIDYETLAQNGSKTEFLKATVDGSTFFVDYVVKTADGSKKITVREELAFVKSTESAHSLPDELPTMLRRRIDVQGADDFYLMVPALLVRALKYDGQDKNNTVGVVLAGTNELITTTGSFVLETRFELSSSSFTP